MSILVPSIISLAGNEKIILHKSLDQFEFKQDPTTGFGVSCHWASDKSRYKVVNTLDPSFLIKSFSFVQVRRVIIKSGPSLKFSLIGQCTTQLAALKCLNNSPYTYNGKYFVNILVPPFLTGSSSFLQETMTCISAWMTSNFNQI